VKKLRLITAHLLGVTLFVGEGSAFAQSKAAATPATIEPGALTALDTMYATLQKLSDFTVTADITNEIVLEGAQKLQFGGKVKIEVHRPTAFKITTDSDAITREIYYDGKSLTIFAPRLNYYATVPAPASIGLTLDSAKTKYGIELPLADLFSWGSDQTIRARIQSGYVVRPEHIGDRLCTHYAFRQAKVDWQIWLQDDAGNLPCKMVITNRDDSAQPQYVAVLNWTDKSALPASTFMFVPPANAHKIAIVDVSDATLKGK